MGKRVNISLPFCIVLCAEVGCKEAHATFVLCPLPELGSSVCVKSKINLEGNLEFQNVE